MTRTDKIVLVSTALFVGGLAVVAEAIFFAHVVELAVRHDQTGWKAYAFPVSIDGPKSVATCTWSPTVAPRRAAGWIPWVALVVGILASLTANAAVSGQMPSAGRWPVGPPLTSMVVSDKRRSGVG